MASSLLRVREEAAALAVELTRVQPEEDPETVRDIVARAAALHMTQDVLETTPIGRIVNGLRKRDIPPDVKDAVRALVRRWKALIAASPLAPIPSPTTLLNPPPQPSKPKGRRKVVSPRVAPIRLKTPHTSLATLLAAWKALGFKGDRFNIILCGPGQRWVATETAPLAAVVPCPGFSKGRFGTMDHNFTPGARGRGYGGENQGFLMDCSGAMRDVSMFCEQVPGALGFLDTMYGPGCFFCLDRKWFRKTLKPESTKKLEEGRHIDFPAWSKVDAEITLFSLHVPEGHCGVLLLDQGAPHSIPRGGSSHGVYLSPVARGMGVCKWNAALCETWAHNFDQNTKLSKKDGSPVKINAWRKALTRLGRILEDVAVVLAHWIVFDLPPLIYPSGKPVKIAYSYSPASWRCYLGQVAPNKAAQLLDPVHVLAEMETTYPPELIAPFRALAALMPDERWVINPCTVAPTARMLARFMFMEQ